MTTELKRHYLKKVLGRYHRSGKKQKSPILDEFCEFCGISRKHGIKLMNEAISDLPRKPGRKRTYGSDVDAHLYGKTGSTSCCLRIAFSPTLFK